MDIQGTEKVFYQDANVTITQSRFVSSSKTYAMRNIASVTMHHFQKSRIWQILIIAIGVMCLLAENSRIFGIVMIAIGALALYLTKDEYSVRINSNSGESDGFISKDRLLIQKMVDAVNDAVIYRG